LYSYVIKFVGELCIDEEEKPLNKQKVWGCCTPASSSLCMKEIRGGWGPSSLYENSLSLQV